MTGLSRRGLLAGGLSAAALLGLPRLARAAGDGRLLVYWVPGGWDPSTCFDPHFESGALDRDPSSAPQSAGGLHFAGAASRPSVQAFFAAHGSRTVIVNGLAVGSISHSQCTRLVLTGSRRSGAADLATQVAAGATGGFPLPHLVVSGPRFPGNLGQYCSPLNPLLTGTVRGELPRDALFENEREARIRAWLAEETEARSELQPSAALDIFRDGLRRFDALEASVEAIHVREYALERELLEAGVNALAEGLSRCVTVGGSLPFMSQWDSHTNNHSFQDRNHEHLFAELSWLLARMAALPDPGGGGGSLLEATTVLVMSEMGRTPVLNGAAGKDHWPYTSLMLIGPGVAGGRVLGATNAALVAQPIGMDDGLPASSGAVLSPAAVAAGLLSHLDVDPEPAFPGVEPFRAPYG